MPVVSVNRDKLFEALGRVYSECWHAGNAAPAAAKMILECGEELFGVCRVQGS